jgi:hypothetical protein
VIDKQRTKAVEKPWLAVAKRIGELFLLKCAYSFSPCKNDFFYKYTYLGHIRRIE